MRLAIISDTHMPRGERALPTQCVEQLRSADLIVHAGDLVRVQVLELLKTFGPVVAVSGNVDDGDVRTRLPAEAIIDADGVRVAVLHNAGPARRRLDRMRQRFPEAAAVVFGHSHVPLHEQDASGFQIFNPGSPTERRRAPRHTMGLARIAQGRIVFELISL